MEKSLKNKSFLEKLDIVFYFFFLVLFAVFSFLGFFKSFETIFYDNLLQLRKHDFFGKNTAEIIVSDERLFSFDEDFAYTLNALHDFEVSDIVIELSDFDNSILTLKKENFIEFLRKTENPEVDFDNLIDSKNRIFEEAFKNNGKIWVLNSPSLEKIEGIKGCGNFLPEKNNVTKIPEISLSEKNNIFLKVIADFLSASECSEKANSFFLKNAKLPGADKTKNIQIPVDKQKNMLLFPFKNNSFKKNSMEKILLLKKLEQKIKDLLSVAKTSEEFSEQNENMEIDLLRKEYENTFNQLKEDFRNKIVLIGDEKSFENLDDFACATEQVSSGNLIYPVFWAFSYFIVAMIFGAVLFASRRCAITVQIFVNSVLCIALSVLPIVLLVVFNIYIEFYAPFLFLFCSGFFCLKFRLCRENKKRKKIFQIFSPYVSTGTVEKIIKNPALVNSDGKKISASILLSKIKDFSGLCEKLENPSLLRNILSEYFSLMNKKIFEQNGSLDKFLNGNIRSIFGYPVAFRDHAYFSCLAALNMKKAENDFNKKHLILGDLPFELHSMIQINTGNMIAGDFGSETKRNFTVIGKEVDFCQQLETISEMYDEWIICTEETWNSIDYGAHKNEIATKKLDKVIYEGKERPVQIYSILGLKNELTRQKLEEISVFEEALELFNAHEFEKAAEKFIFANELIPEDKAALIFAERCKKYLCKNINENSDCVLDLSEKKYD